MAGAEPALLRGVGVGNWLLPEGYMWRFNAGATSPRRIEAIIAQALGQADAEQFWVSFRDNFFTQADIAEIARLGFDHIRLPFNARLLIDSEGTPLSGFDYVDRCLDWAHAAGLGVVLDLHAAPGGQTGANIDDSQRDLPELFTDPANRELTIELWRLLARRYVNHPAVIAYDLLNEPLPDKHAQLWPDLVPLYRDLTRAIREIDTDHVIMYEGAHWATNFTMFESPLDDNACLQFHHYWSPVNPERFEALRTQANQLGMAIYMGESGENSPEWIREMFTTCTQRGISWNFWPWKKLDTTTSPFSAPAPTGWEAMIAWAEGHGPALSRSQAAELLTEFLGNIKLSNCQRRDEIIAALPLTPP